MAGTAKLIEGGGFRLEDRVSARTVLSRLNDAAGEFGDYLFLRNKEEQFPPALPWKFASIFRRGGGTNGWRVIVPQKGKGTYQPVTSIQ
jgi:hypothetical protein